MRSPLLGTIDGPKGEKGAVVIELFAMWEDCCRVVFAREGQSAPQDGCRLTTFDFFSILGRT
jgi:hypothetical protein